MKLAVAGGRDFNDFTLLNETICIHFMCEIDEVDTIISGGAKGADSLAKRWALINRPEGMKYEEFLPDWNSFGKGAGFIRNQQIVDACDILLAFWDGKSKGTEDTIDKARKAKKSTFIVYY